MAASTKQDDIQMMLVCKTHFGTLNCDYRMKRYASSSAASHTAPLHPPYPSCSSHHPPLSILSVPPSVLTLPLLFSFFNLLGSAAISNPLPSSFSSSLSLYIYICMYVCIYIYISLSLSSSLSPSFYPKKY